MSLRFEKQRKQRQKIIENAIALFRNSEDAAVSVREIAGACHISEATFFNYFKDKDALLAEWVLADLEAQLLAAAELAREQHLRRAVRSLARAIGDRVGEDGDLMARAWCCVRTADLDLIGTEARGRIASPDGARALLAPAVAREELRQDLPPAQLAELFRATLVVTLARALGAPERPPSKSLALRIRKALDLMLDGFRKRNERVRAQAASS